MSSSVLFGRNLDCVARKTTDDAGRVRRASLALLWMTVGAVVCTARGKFSVRPLASAHGEGQMGSADRTPLEKWMKIKHRKRAKKSSFESNRGRQM